MKVKNESNYKVFLSYCGRALEAGESAVVVLPADPRLAADLKRKRVSVVSGAVVVLAPKAAPKATKAEPKPVAKPVAKKPVAKKAAPKSKKPAAKSSGAKAKKAKK
jgi:hypothetical protein